MPLPTRGVITVGTLKPLNILLEQPFTHPGKYPLAYRHLEWYIQLLYTVTHVILTSMMEVFASSLGFHKSRIGQNVKYALEGDRVQG